AVSTRFSKSSPSNSLSSNPFSPMVKPCSIVNFSARSSLINASSFVKSTLALLPSPNNSLNAKFTPLLQDPPLQ
ncbi:hypothetical protein L3081_15755, partial [Colwellia sp. MSW7]